MAGLEEARLFSFRVNGELVEIIIEESSMDVLRRHHDKLELFMSVVTKALERACNGSNS